MKKIILALVLLFAFNANITANAEEVKTYELRIKNHTFSPSEIEVPANTKIKLKVINEDKTPEEFESYDLKKEKVIKGNSEAIINVNGLKPGVYKFFGEFNEATAKGSIIVK
jgi:hypothetical protein